MSITKHSGEGSPFDAIRRTRPDGSEFWAARDLMPLMGYTRWEDFQTAIERAKAAAVNSGMNVEEVFRRAPKNPGQQGGRPQSDFELSRFAAYLVALNGDPRKAETAAAQAYFVVRTREAETRTAAPALTDDEIIHRALTLTARRVEALSARVQELEPKADFYDALMDANGCYSFLAAAKILGWGRNVLMRDLRRMGVLQGNNLPYQRYEHHFKVVPGTYVNPRTGETVPTATTFVLPSGLEFLRRKLVAASAVAGVRADDVGRHGVIGFV